MERGSGGRALLQGGPPCQAGGVGLLHIELGQDVLPAGLLGQLLHIVLSGVVDEVEELRAPGPQGERESRGVRPVAIP